MSIIVSGAGRAPSPVVFVGEAPGAEEANRLEPFVGKSGREQSSYLAHHGITFRHYYRTNVVKEFIPGNPDPTIEQIESWTPVLIDELADCQPRLVIAVGRFAMRWFLGPDANLETCHGKVWSPGEFSPTPEGYQARVPDGCVILPIYHPALGLYDIDARAVIAWDYSQVAVAIKLVKTGSIVRLWDSQALDEIGDGVDYHLCTGDDMDLLLDAHQPRYLSIDTEGSESNPWSIQVSIYSGRSFILLCSDADFRKGIESIQRWCLMAEAVILHNAMWDIPVCLSMGLDLYNPRIKLFDTMTAAYLLRFEPQGLKPLARRHCGMHMSSYLETIGQTSDAIKLAYLQSAAAESWPVTDPITTLENDGTVKTRKPQSIPSRLRKILKDYDKLKSTNEAVFAALFGWDTEDGDSPIPPSAADLEGLDLDHRWKQLPLPYRRLIESRCGPYPTPTLDSIPLPAAIHYAGRDSDATLRLYHVLKPELARLDLTRTMQSSMSVLQMFSQMQRNGMPVDRSKLESLADRMTIEYHEYRERIADTYFDGGPFNPNSGPQVGQLLKKCRLRGTKFTEGGEVSTSKKSIQHLRFTQPAISDVFEARERAHVRDNFCLPIIDRIPVLAPLYFVRCQVKTTRTTTRRLATSDPNLLAVPSRTEIGKAVRECYVAPDGYLFGGADLSQIEVRVMAHHSRDPLLCRLLRQDADVHRITASKIFGVPESEVTKDQRRAAKTIKFGIMYGMGGPALYDQLMTEGVTLWSVADCEQMIADYLNEVYTGIRDYIARVARETADTGYSRTTGGMYRYIPGIWSTDLGIRAESIRVAVSQRIQGDAQEMIQSSMAWMWPRIYELQTVVGVDVRPCLQIHDEAIFLIPVEWEEVVRDIVMEGLTEHCGLRLCVPVKAEWKSGPTWESLK